MDEPTCHTLFQGDKEKTERRESARFIELHSQGWPSSTFPPPKATPSEPPSSSWTTPPINASVSCSSSDPDIVSKLSKLFDGVDTSTTSKGSDQPLHSQTEIDEYMTAKYFGLYDDTCGADGHDASSWEAQKLAWKLCRSVVTVCCPTSGLGYLFTAGIVVNWNGDLEILTAASFLGRCPSYRINDEVFVIESDGKKSIAKVMYYDEHYNIVVITARNDAMLEAATFSPQLMELDDVVTAIGRNRYGRLMASQGKINIRGDHLDSDDLMSSSCSISEWGIGGPLVNSCGQVIGMNYFSNKGSTPFIPSIFLLEFIDHYHRVGRFRVTRPLTGLKIRSVNELRSYAPGLEHCLLGDSITGLFVREVEKGSQADRVGIKVGDIITAVDNHQVTTPAQVTCVLLKKINPADSSTNAMSLHVEGLRLIGRFKFDNLQLMMDLKDFTSNVTNSWPLLPHPQFKNGKWSE